MVPNAKLINKTIRFINWYLLTNIITIAFRVPKVIGTQLNEGES